MAGPVADGSVLLPAVPCALELPLSEARCAQVLALALPAAPPAAAGNRYADHADAASLGFLAFFDPRFSGLADIRCASCHQPEHGFAEPKAVSEVVAGRPLSRNSLSILNAAWSGPFYFWDGRADSLWSQPLFALESADEMAGSRLAVAHALYDTPSYRSRYERLFGPMPELSDSRRFPAHGKPGDASFDAMASADGDAINLVFANLGKSFEAYMRKVATGPSDLDRFLSGERSALDASAQRGLTVFAMGGCIDCHAGPTLSDHAFHNMGAQTSDKGRASAVAVLVGNLFNSRGPYWDDEVGERPSIPSGASTNDEGAFRTPTLRNLPRTAPYGHNGGYASVEDFLATGHGEALNEQQTNDLVIFLLSLNGRYPERPWSDWPAR
jgi:cytochrome c peroxidase